MNDESLLIQNARIVSSAFIEETTIWIEKGIIRSLGNIPGNIRPAKIIDAKNLYVLPGVIDSHVHFREPGMEWKEDLNTGSRAAVSGGVTSFLEMPNTQPPTTTAEALAHKKHLASQKSYAHYGFFLGAAPGNLDQINDIPDIPGIKVFMGSSTGTLLLSDFQKLEQLFSTAQKLLAVHAEDDMEIQQNKNIFPSEQCVYNHPLIRSPKAALNAVRKAVSLANRYQKRLHLCHLTSLEEVEFLSGNKNSLISCEVTPQHLFLSSPEVYERFKCLAQVNPPIRDLSHAKTLWKALKNGIIDLIATDHAPHTLEEKSKPYGEAPSGAPGVELSLPLFLDQVNKGHCSLKEVAKWMCERPAKIFQIKNKGFIRPGMDADLVLIDLDQSKTVRNQDLQTKCRWSLFEGMPLKGWPVMTLVDGHVTWREGTFFEDYKGRELLFS